MFQEKIGNQRGNSQRCHLQASWSFASSSNTFPHRSYRWSLAIFSDKPYFRSAMTSQATSTPPAYRAHIAFTTARRSSVSATRRISLSFAPGSSPGVADAIFLVQKGAGLRCSDSIELSRGFGMSCLCVGKFRDQTTGEVRSKSKPMAASSSSRNHFPPGSVASDRPRTRNSTTTEKEHRQSSRRWKVPSLPAQMPVPVLAVAAIFLPLILVTTSIARTVPVKHLAAS